MSLKKFLVIWQPKVKHTQCS